MPKLGGPKGGGAGLVIAKFAPLQRTAARIGLQGGATLVLSVLNWTILAMKWFDMV